ncbi:hypothetical protein V8D89_007535 [Ganoderma adspersum]
MTNKTKVVVAHSALAIFDVVLAIFEQLSPIQSASLSPLNAPDLRTCALVCRAWAEPALCTLWSDVPSLFPFWYLLAPPDLPYPRWSLSQPELESEYFALIISAKLHESPARWDLFLRYARRVRILAAGQSRSRLQLDFTRIILGHNKGVSVFPSLKELYWFADSVPDVVAFSPLLLTPELRSTAFFSLTAMPTKHGVDLYDGNSTADWTSTAGYGMLMNLANSSPHVVELRISTKQPITCVPPAVRGQASFHRLRVVSFVCNIYHSILLLFVAKPCIESVQASNVVPDNPPLPGSVANRGRTRASSTLVQLDISGEWPSLYLFFEMLDAPSLQSAALNIDRSETLPLSEYAVCAAAFADVVSSAALTKLALNITGCFPAHRVVADPLASIVNLDPILEPLLALRNLRSFALSSPIVLLHVTDKTLERAARSWPQLIDFVMPVKPLGSPTTRALYFFWRYCPALRRLVLPQLNVSCVAAKDLPPLAPAGGATHGLSELRVLIGEHRDDDSRKGQGELPADEATALAAYVHRLFPALVLDDGHRQPPREDGKWGVPAAWRKVFACMGDL